METIRCNINDPEQSGKGLIGFAQKIDNVYY
jgi:hypothetical protein